MSIHAKEIRVSLCPNVGKIEGCLGVSALYIGDESYLSPPLEFVQAVLHGAVPIKARDIYCETCENSEDIV